MVGEILIKRSVLRVREGVSIINIEQLDISVFFITNTTKLSCTYNIK